jgi:hypothetical protein
VALIIGCSTLRPAVQHLVGAPRGSHEGYISGDADIQALAVQALCVSLALFAFGLIVGKGRQDLRLRGILGIVNPGTIGLSYLSYRLLMILRESALPEARWQSEYYSAFNGICVSLLAYPLFAPLMRLGIRLRQQNALGIEPGASRLRMPRSVWFGVCVLAAFSLLLVPAVTSVFGRAIEPSSALVLLQRIDCRTPLGIPCYTIRFDHSAHWGDHVFTRHSLAAVRQDGSYLNEDLDETDTSVATGSTETFGPSVELYLAPPRETLV